MRIKLPKGSTANGFITIKCVCLLANFNIIRKGSSIEAFAPLSPFFVMSICLLLH